MKVAYKITPVWKKVSPELEKELVDFWNANKAVNNDADPSKRAKQAVCVARDDKGQIVGVSTAHPRIVPRLRQPMYYYRNFIAESARQQKLGGVFLEESKKALQDFNMAQAKPLCLGVLIELENKAVAAHRNEAQWKEGFTFIGYSPKGNPMRVWYFDGIKLFPPAQLKKAAAKKAAAAPARA
jgi:hypothetical protein